MEISWGKTGISWGKTGTRCVCASCECPKFVSNRFICFDFYLEALKHKLENLAERAGDKNKGLEAQLQHLEIPQSMNTVVSKCLVK